MYKCYATTVFALFCINLASSGTVFAQNKSLTRDLEPVVVAGADLSAHIGAPVGSSNELFLYAYRNDGDVWEQIPFQIDEVSNEDSTYFTADDGVLDGNDELVFMAKDAGDRANNSLWLDDQASQSNHRIEIAVSDPLAGGGLAWVYLFRSPSLSLEPGVEDYVDYISPPPGKLGGDQVAASTYHMGHAENGFPDSILIDSSVGGDGKDLLDAFKLRAVINIGLDIPITEDFVELKSAEGDGIVARDGAVRVIRAVNASFNLVVTRDFPIPPFIYYANSMAFKIDIPDVSDFGATIKSGRFSIDLSDRASGMNFVSPNNSPGFSVDGTPETPAPDKDLTGLLPDNNWAFLGGAQGTIVHLFPLKPDVGGGRQLYYKDDATTDQGDTGDKKSFGDVGIDIFNEIQPPVTFNYRGYYLGTGFDSSIGAQIAEFERMKLETDFESQTFSGPSSVAGGTQLPEQFELAQNFPNPFNPSTEIHYQVGRGGAGQQLTLVLYNLLGQAVRTLVDGIATPGQFSVIWDGLNDAGEALPTGVYIYRLTSSSFKASRKLVLVK